jgi:D-amino peptidase
MISGDQVACAQACELLGTLETAVVKQASGRYSAECLSPTASHELIHVAARRATLRLKKQDVPAPYVLETPITLTVDFVRSELADRAALFPGCERDGLRIAVTTEDMCQTFMAFRTLTALAGL